MEGPTPASPRTTATRSPKIMPCAAATATVPRTPSISTKVARFASPPGLPRTGVIPVHENPVGLLLMDFVDLVTPAAGSLTGSGTSPSNRVLFKKDGPDSIHMPEAYVKPLTSAQMADLATPQIRP